MVNQKILKLPNNSDSDVYTRLKKIKKRGGGINNYKEPNVFNMCVIIRVKRPFVICMVFILRLFPKGTTGQHSN